MHQVRSPYLIAALAAALCTGTALAPASAADASAESARTALEAAAKAYRGAPALEDTLTYVIQAPNSDPAPKTLLMKLGAGKDAAVIDPLLGAYAIGNRLYLTKSDAPGHFVSRPYSGDFGAALNAIVGEQGSLFEPAEVAMREGKPFEAWLDAFRFKLLPPLSIAGFERSRNAHGGAVDVVHLVAADTTVDVGLDAKTHFFTTLRIETRPPGAPEGMKIRLEGTFAPKLLQSAAGVVAFDRSGATEVDSMADLGTSRIRIGGPAPEFELALLGGGSVASKDLRGKVVVLDFWATWCVPCWATLQETERLRAWAAKSGLPIAVYAVDALEQSATPAEKASKAAEFFRSQKLTLPCLLDADDKVFGALGSPGLPSLIVLAPDGTYFKLHQGMFPDMLATLEAEAAAAAKIAPR